MHNASSPVPAASTADAAEIARFSALATRWWDPKGPMAPLHAMNPARLEFVRDALCRQFDRSPTQLRPLAGLRLLDLGCGAGLLTEPLARMGANVVGIDAAAAGIDAAGAHAAATGLEIDYRCTTAEAMVTSGEMFDGVISLEVVEHVADVSAYLSAIHALLRPGGLAVL